MRSVVAFGLVCLASVLAQPSQAVAQGVDLERRPFPDEWFFDGAQRPAPLKALEGKPATALAIEGWIGDSIDLAEQRGKVVIIDFWATWCGPCLAAIPHNAELVRRYADEGLVFVGVHDANSGWDRAASIVRDRGINYPVGKDRSGSISAKAYAVQFWPTYVAIDRAGIVRGAGLSTDRVEQAIRLLLDEAPPAPAPAAAEFAAEFYYGGDSRPARLREIEGTMATPLRAQAWPDSGPIDLRGDVAVITFVTPNLAVSMRELVRVDAMAKELAPQGVRFVGVCDGLAPWESMTQAIAERSITVAVMHDDAPDEHGHSDPDAAESSDRPLDQEATDRSAKHSAVGGVDTPRAQRWSGVTALAYGVELLPTTIIVDRTGRVRAAGVRADRIKAVVETLLAEAAEAPPIDEETTPVEGRTDS